MACEADAIDHTMGKMLLYCVRAKLLPVKGQGKFWNLPLLFPA